MRNKSIIKIIIILLIFIFLILIAKVYLEKKNEKERMYGVEIPEGSLDFDMNLVKKIASKSDYFLAKDCIEKFYDYYINDKEIYNLLDNEYIKDFNLNEENIKNRYGSYNNIIVDITRYVLFTT